MSRRPRVVSRHEKSVERRVQKARSARDRKNRAEPLPDRTGGRPEPHILSRDLEPVEELPTAVRAWIEAEGGKQIRRYRRIFRQQEELAPMRDRWVKEFFARITGPRGFSVHAGTRRTIPKGEIPKRPRRPWRVVW
jgi:hypothetical protein